MATKDEVKKVENETKEESQSVETTIEAWFTKHFKGNIIAADEKIYNMCHAAKEELKKLFS